MRNRTFYRLFSKTALLVSFCLLTGSSYAQDPGGVSGWSEWIINHSDPEDYTHSNANKHTRVGMYQSLRDTLVYSYFDTIAYRDLGGTMFVVLKPILADTTVGEDLFIAGSQIGQNHIITRGDTSDHVFQAFKPQIVTVRKSRRSQNAPLLKYVYKEDPSKRLFDITEFIYYDHVLSPYHTRKVESYLAFKYGINIVKDTTSVLNDYYSADSVVYWDYDIDYNYKDVILGLGQNDSTNFRLTQAVTADSNDMVFSIDTVTRPGFIPVKPLSHGDFIMFAKDERPADSSCAIKQGYKLINGTWKLRKYRWSEQGQKLIIGVRKSTNRTNSDSAKLWVTNGVQEYLLNHKKDLGKYRFYKVPIDSIVAGTDYFFEVVEMSTYCYGTTNVYLMAQASCDNKYGGKVRVSVPQSLLPAELVINNSSYGSSYCIDIENTLTDIDGLTAGQYEFLIKASDYSREKHLKWISPGYDVRPNTDGARTNSFSMNGSTATDFCECEIDQNHTLSAFIPEEPKLTAYPVPAQKGNKVTVELYNPEGFAGELRIIDLSGRILKHVEFDGAEGLRWDFEFDPSGIYHVEIKTQFHHLHQEIIIQ